MWTRRHHEHTCSVVYFVTHFVCFDLTVSEGLKRVFKTMLGEVGEGLPVTVELGRGGCKRQRDGGGVGVGGEQEKSEGALTRMQMGRGGVGRGSENG